MRVLNNVFKYLSSVTEVNDEKDDDYLKDFDCPICMSKMVDPVICEDGHYRVIEGLKVRLRNFLFRSPG